MQLQNYLLEYIWMNFIFLIYLTNCVYCAHVFDENIQYFGTSCCVIYAHVFSDNIQY